MLMAQSFRSRVSASARLLTLVPALLLLIWTGANASSVAAAPASANSAAATLSCGTGWHAVASPPINNNGYLLGVASIPGTKRLWAVGYQDNGIATTSLIERWNGFSWNVVASPTVAGAAENLQAITALSASDAWAVGTGYANPTTTAAILHWNGSQWTLVPSPNPGRAYNVLNGVAALSANNVWAVGYQTSDPSNGSPQQLIEHWDGHAWSVAVGASLSGNSTLAAITRVPGTNQLLAVGAVQDPVTAPDRTLIERWTGSAWTRMPSPNFGGTGNDLYAITALSGINAWAVGTYDGPSNGQDGVTPQTLTEHFNGSAWKVVASPNVINAGMLVENELLGVTALSASEVFAVGAYFNPSGDYSSALAERWNGSRWSLISPNTLPSVTTLNSVTHVPGTSQVWAVGDAYSVGPDQPLIETRC